MVDVISAASFPWKLAVVTTHPIQYQVPWFRALAAIPEIDLTVYFCMIPDAMQQGEGFGVSFQWDVPLLEGYRHEVLRNVAAQPTFAAFRGCDTPEVGVQLTRGGYDAVIVNGWVVKSCLQALNACRRNRIPCIVRGESNDLRHRPWWKRLAHRVLLSRYSAFLAIGAANRRFYLANGVEKRRIFDAPYCAENRRFATSARALRPTRGEIRAGWGIPADAVVYLFCAKFVPKKRPLDFLVALRAARALPGGGRAHALLVGTGELLRECRDFAAQHQLPVSFAGFLNQADIARAYVSADCLVLPSDTGETWGLVVNEAMACGVPAIVSDQVGCQQDLVVRGATGDVYPMGDTRALAVLLAENAAAPEQLVAMGEEAWKRLERGYSYERVVEGTLAALRFVAGRA